MSTVRGIRVEAALRAIQKAKNLDPWVGDDTLANLVVDALFPPDPMIDNAAVPAGIVSARTQRALGINR